MVEAVLFIEVKSREHHIKIVKFKFIEKHRYADSKKLPLHKGAFLYKRIPRDSRVVQKRLTGESKKGHKRRMRKKPSPAGEGGCEAGG